MEIFRVSVCNILRLQMVGIHYSIGPTTTCTGGQATSINVHTQWPIQGGGAQQARATPAYFRQNTLKKSPKLAKIYQKILGGKPPKPRRPPFYRSWIRHWHIIP